MSDQTDPEFIAYLAATTGLPAATCRRLVLEVLAQYDETLEDFVQRRHQQLQAVPGMKNPEIFTRIATEIPQRRFSATAPSARQIRRLIYG